MIGMYNLKSLEKNAQTIKPYGPQIQTNQKMYIQISFKNLFQHIFINSVEPNKSLHVKFNSIACSRKIVSKSAIVVAQDCNCQMQVRVVIYKGKGTSRAK